MLEIIYVDDKRLDSYAEQLGSPNTTDKVPVWNVGLSLAGPKAGAVQTQSVRKLTQIEKIRIVVEGLTKNGWVQNSSPKHSSQIWGYGEPEFRIDTFTATRLFLPPKESVNFEGLMLWIAYYHVVEENDGLILLMESVANPDKEKEYVSSYSAFLLFTSHFEPQLKVTGIREDFFRPKNEERFLTNPISCLADSGAKVIGERTITVLYRVRVGIERNKMEEGNVIGPLFTTVAYPIVIAQGSVSIV